MKVTGHELAALPKQASANDALNPYKEALREHFPSREALLQEAKQQTRRQRMLKKVTAGVTFSFVIALSWVIDPVWHREEMHTMVGQQASFDLKDGSHVDLNTNSVLVVEQHLYSRQLQLTQGEALFTVQHGWRPFIVFANQTQIRDIGTIFNVRNIEDGAVVTVVEGSVEVRTANAQRILTKDISVTTQAGTISESRCTSANIAWQQGRLVFDGTPLQEAVAEIQRYRQAPIVIQDSKVGLMRVSGEYDINAIESLLKTLPLSLGIHVSYQTDGKVILSK
jgi:transmembrane sensor